MRALARLLASDFAGMLSRLRRRALAVAAQAAAAGVAYDFWRQFKLAEELEEIRQSSARGVSGAAGRDRRCRSSIGRTWGSSRMIVNQWIPAAHRGDAVGDNARVLRDLFRELGPRRPRSTRCTIDDELTGEVRAVARRRRSRRRRDDPALRACRRR